MTYRVAGTLHDGSDCIRRIRPCVVNYGVQFRRSLASKKYFITPSPAYSNLNGVPPYGLGVEEGSNSNYIGTETECEAKLDRDLSRMAESGFNTVRVVGVGPFVMNGNLTLPVRPEIESTLPAYLDLLTTLLDRLAAHGLWAIILVGANTDGKNQAQWEHPKPYRDYLKAVASHLDGHPALLAYDLYNEPGWSYPWGKGFDKLLTSHWIADSYWTIKEQSRSALVTIGLTGFDTAILWDPVLIPVDFVSHHYWPHRTNVELAKSQVTTLLAWSKAISRRPWIIGETGFAGTDAPSYKGVLGTEADQRDFADYTMPLSLDYGCAGYSWWQFQDVEWKIPDVLWEDHYGVITVLDPLYAASSELEKAVLQAFRTYRGAVANPSNAKKPVTYGNPGNHPVAILSGKIIDGDGAAISDATVQVEVEVLSKNEVFTALSGADGSYKLHISADASKTIKRAFASKPGFSVADLDKNSGNGVLVPLHDDSWSRRWNARNAGEIDYSTDSGYGSWKVRPSDKFYVGDFDNDGSDELLCVQTGEQTGDEMTLLRFDGQWRLEWSNHGDAAAGGGIYPYRNQLVVGDYLGDGSDLVLGTSDDAWITVFRYMSGDWHWAWSTGEEDHGLKPYAKRLFACNLSGTSDYIVGFDLWSTLFQFDDAVPDFVWIDSDNGKTNQADAPMSYIRPYRDELLIGDFDSDGRDELLGISRSSTGPWITMFGIRGGASLEWLLTNGGQAEDPLTSLSLFNEKRLVGHFDGTTADRVLALGNTHAAMFGLEGGSFERIWSTNRKSLAGVDISVDCSIHRFQPVTGMPDYVLIIPRDGGTPALVAFDPLPNPS